MTVVCKYYVARSTTTEQKFDPKDKPAKLTEIELRAVSDGSPENKMFYAWTPYGSLTLRTKDQGLVDTFAEWGQFYLLIDEVEPKSALVPGSILMRVSKLGNRTDDTSKKYDVEMEAQDPRVEGGNWNMGTVNEAAAKAFLSMGSFRVTFSRSSPA